MLHPRLSPTHPRGHANLRFPLGLRPSGLRPLFPLSLEFHDLED
jgi:hypothetical protein